MSLEPLQPLMPDPLAHMPTVAPDLGNKLWERVGEGIQAFMDGLVERVGEIAGAVITKGPGAITSALGGSLMALGGGASAMNPFKTDFIAGGSPEAQGQEIASPSRGLSLTPEAPGAPTANYAMLMERAGAVDLPDGQAVTPLQTGPLPGRALGQSQGMALS